MEELRVFKILRLRDDSIEFIDDEVAVEQAIHLHVNKEHLTTFLATPMKLKELAYGHLASEGIIRRASDIEKLTINRFVLNVRIPRHLMTRVRIYSMVRIRYSSCGQAPENYVRLLDSLMKLRISSETKFTVKHVFKAIRLLNEKSEVFRRTGGVHAALLMDLNYNIIGFAEDVGRHNAVDKAVGEALLKGADFSKLILACTGRLSSEMVLKAIRLNIPVLASIAAPTDAGISLARKAGLTLIGFVRGRRMNIYSMPERVVMNSCQRYS